MSYTLYCRTEIENAHNRLKISVSERENQMSQTGYATSSGRVAAPPADLASVINDLTGEKPNTFDIIQGIISKHELDERIMVYEIEYVSLSD